MRKSMDCGPVLPIVDNGQTEQIDKLTSALKAITAKYQQFKLKTKTTIGQGETGTSNLHEKAQDDKTTQ